MLYDFHDSKRLLSTNEINRLSLREIIDFVQSVVFNLLSLNSISYYFQHLTFLSSIFLSLLYFMFLFFFDQMIIFLLVIDYTFFAVSVAHAISIIFKLFAT